MLFLLTLDLSMLNFLPRFSLLIFSSSSFWSHLIARILNRQGNKTSPWLCSKTHNQRLRHQARCKILGWAVTALTNFPLLYFRHNYLNGHHYQFPQNIQSYWEVYHQERPGTHLFSHHKEDFQGHLKSLFWNENTNQLHLI